MTRLETEVLTAIIARGGVVESLFRLAAEVGWGYDKAWYTVKRLESRGLVNVRKPAKSLVISI